VITTIAGSGNPGYSGDRGPATNASFRVIGGLTVDSAGNLYVADMYNHRIRRIDGGTGVISTIAGNGTYGYNGDDLWATSVSLNIPMDVAIDGAGNLYIADYGNSRIRKVVGAQHPPFLASIGDREVYEGDSLTVALSASDAAGDMLSYAVSGGPLGATLTGTVFGWRPSYTQAGDYPLTFTVTDGRWGMDQLTVLVSVHGLQILSVADVPNDQGRQVRITWGGHEDDAMGYRGDYPVTEYSVWRLVDPQLSSYLAKLLATPDSNGTPLGEWDFLSRIAANQSERYNAIVPTLADSTTANRGYHSTYFVQAHTTHPLVHYSAKPDSGCSVDNLTPGVPSGLSAKVAGSGVVITWQALQDSDLDYYLVYRGSTPHFVPGALWTATSQNRLEVAADPSSPYYRVAGVDFSGNRGASSAAVAVTLECGVDYQLSGGWNMVSLACQADDPSLLALFPTARAAFSFDDGYHDVQRLECLRGYWINLAAAATVRLTGTPVAAPIANLPSSWSMVAPADVAVDVPALKAAYPSLTSVFGYAGGYRPVTRMEPGRAYWLNLSAPTQVDLSGVFPSGARALATDEALDGGSTLWVEGPGGSTPLELGAGSVNGGQLPPSPPPGGFDARVEVGGVATFRVPAVDGAYRIRLQGAVDRLRWQVPEGSRWQLDIAGNRTPLVGNGTVPVQGGAEVWLYHGAAMPRSTMLHPCYPNPFNPSTVIRYDLVAASDVRLRIRSITGQLIRELVWAHSAPGAHEVEWDGCDATGLPVANGVYLCRLEAGTYRGTQRMVLAK
jgi:hypothetical protein